MNDRYDAVIIGAGLGGLVCGALLARHGAKVLICEKHSKPGGYCTSYRRREFTFDIPHVMSGLRKGAPAERILSHLGVMGRTSFIELESVGHAVFADAEIDCWTDLRRYEHDLCEQFPHEARGIRACVRELEQAWDDVLFLRPGPGMSALVGITFEQFLTRHIRDAALRETMAIAREHVGPGGGRAPAPYMAGIYMGYHGGGAWRPVGGHQSLSDSLAAAAVDFGASLSYGTAVKRIVLPAGRAGGVELANGGRCDAGCIVSNADTKQTYLELVGRERLGESLAMRVLALGMSPSGVNVRLGLRGQLPGIFRAASVMYCRSREAIKQRHVHYESGELENPFGNAGLGMAGPSANDSTLAPAGCSVLDIGYYPAPGWNRKLWDRQRQMEYTSFKQSLADGLVKYAEEIVPGLSSRIVVQDVCTPATYERYTGATHGTWFDVTPTMGTDWVRRLDGTTLVPGLYVTGTKNAGTGIWGAIYGGFMTADTILKGTVSRAVGLGP